MIYLSLPADIGLTLFNQDPNNNCDILIENLEVSSYDCQEDSSQTNVIIIKI